MNKKTVIILCVIFIILIGLVFVKKNMKPTIPTTEEVVDVVAPPISIDKLTEITLRLGDGAEEDKGKPKNVQLAKEEDNWVVKTQFGVRANEKTIETVLEKLDQLEGELRSEKQELFEDYGISGDEGLHILFQHEGGVIHLVVGMKNAGYQNNFVRFGERNAVYIVNQNLLALFGVREEDDSHKLDANKWSDKRIAHMKTDDVVGIKIMQNEDGAEKAVMDISKENIDGKNKWISATPYAFNLSASKIKNMLDKFNKMYVRDIIASDVDGGFDAPGWTATFVMKDGEEEKYVRGKKDGDEKNYYVRKEGAQYFYLVPVSTFNNRETQQGDIIANNPLKLDENSIDKIDINDMDNKKVFNALKKTAAAAETTDAEAQGEAADKGVWQNANGESIEASKVKDVIKEIKEMKVKIIAPVASLPAAAMTLSVTKEGGTKDYTISENIVLDNGDNCHVLRAGSDKQDYCVSKAHVEALQKALP